MRDRPNDGRDFPECVWVHRYAERALAFAFGRDPPADK